MSTTFKLIDTEKTIKIVYNTGSLVYPQGGLVDLLDNSKLSALNSATNFPTGLVDSIVFSSTSNDVTFSFKNGMSLTNHVTDRTSQYFRPTTNSAFVSNLQGIDAINAIFSDMLGIANLFDATEFRIDFN